MTLLLVDDEKDTRTVARLSLQQLGGFTVIEASSGAEALQIAANTPLDGVILDVMMPGMDGPGVLAALRAAPVTASLPVVFLTAKAMPDEVARLRGLGAVGIETKPFDPPALVAAVRAALDLAKGTPTRPATAPVPATAPASAPAEEDLSVIDVAALARLKDLTTETGGDLIGGLIDLFEVNTPDSMQQLRSAIASAGVAGPVVERLAHTLKSACASLGATGYAAVARSIEYAARDQSPLDAAPLLDRLAAELPALIARLRAAREQVLAGNGPGARA